MNKGCVHFENNGDAGFILESSIRRYTSGSRARVTLSLSLSKKDSTEEESRSDGLLRVVRIQPGLQLLGVLGDHDGFPIERLASRSGVSPSPLVLGIAVRTFVSKSASRRLRDTSREIRVAGFQKHRRKMASKSEDAIISEPLRGRALRLFSLSLSLSLSRNEGLAPRYICSIPRLRYILSPQTHTRRDF